MKNVKSSKNKPPLFELTFDGMPNEITEIILMESLKSSIDELKLPISNTNHLEVQGNLDHLLSFAQHFLHIRETSLLINKRCNNLIPTFYVKHLLILKLNKLTVDQKFNALLSFMKLKKSGFVIAALLSFFDVSQLTLEEIFQKHTLLKDAFQQKIIGAARFGATYELNSMNTNILLINDIKKITPELLALLIEIRSLIPLFNDPDLYFQCKLINSALNRLEQEYYDHQMSVNKWKIKRQFDLINFDELCKYHFITNPKKNFHYNIPMLKQLAILSIPCTDNKYLTPLMNAAFNNNLEAVKKLIAEGSDPKALINDKGVVHWALLGSSHPVLEHLLPDEKIKQTDDSNWQELKSIWEWAIRNVDVPMLDYLLKKFRNNLDSYYLNLILTQRINLVRNKEWEKPIPYITEARTLFLINCGIPLQKFSFTKFADTQSKMITELQNQSHQLESVQSKLNGVKKFNKTDTVTSKDVMFACSKSYYPKAKNTNLFVFEDALEDFSFDDALDDYPPDLARDEPLSDQREPNQFVDTYQPRSNIQAKDSKNIQTLTCFAGAAIFSLLCYRYFAKDSNLIKRQIITSKI